MRLEADVAAEIRAARRVTHRRVRREEMASLPVRTRGLPEGHEGDVRLVEIEGIDLNTCGGTHLRATCEIEALKLLGTERLRGGTRLFFVAGGRVRRRLGAHEERTGRLRVLLGAPDVGLAEARGGEARPARRSAEGAPRGGGGARRREGRGARGRQVSRLPRPISTGATSPSCSASASASPPFQEPGVALLTGVKDGVEAFLLAAGGASAADVRVLGAAVAEALGGRGGGSGKLFQGKGSLASRDEALAVLRKRLGT